MCSASYFEDETFKFVRPAQRTTAREWGGVCFLTLQASDSAEQAEFLVSQSSATCTLGWRSANLIER